MNIYKCKHLIQLLNKFTENIPYIVHALNNLFFLRVPYLFMVFPNDSLATQGSGHLLFPSRSSEEAIGREYRADPRRVCVRECRPLHRGACWRRARSGWRRNDWWGRGGLRWRWGSRAGRNVMFGVHICWVTEIEFDQSIHSKTRSKSFGATLTFMNIFKGTSA